MSEHDPIENEDEVSNAEDLMRSLAAGPDSDPEAAERWDAKWGPIFRRAIRGEGTPEDEAVLHEAIKKITADLERRNGEGS